MGNGESSISEDQARKAAGNLWSDSKFDALKGPDGRIPLPLSPEALKIFQGPDPTPPRKRPEGEMPVKDVVPQNLWLTHNYVHCNPFRSSRKRRGSAMSRRTRTATATSASPWTGTPTWACAS